MVSKFVHEHKLELLQLNLYYCVVFSGSLPTVRRIVMYLIKGYVVPELLQVTLMVL